MPFKENMIQLGTLLAVFLGFGYLMLSRVIKRKPELRDKIKKIFSGDLIKKTPLEPMQDKIEQVWDEKRTMM